MTTTTLNACLKAIQDIVGRADSAIKVSPEYPPDKWPSGISSIVFLRDGVYSQPIPGVLQGLHNIGIYVACPRVDMRNTLKALYPLGDKVAAALESNPTLLASVSTFGAITYTFDYAINVGTAAAPALIAGWEFTISDVKIEDSTVVS